MFIAQDMGQRCFAVKNSNIIAPATTISSAVLFISSMIAITLGILAKETGLEVDYASNTLIEVVKYFTTPTISAVFVAIIMMAVASTADSVLCSIGSHVSFDILIYIIPKIDDISDKAKINLSRLLTLSIGLSSIWAIYAYDSVVEMLILAYSFSVCTLFIPVMMSVISKCPSRLGAIISIMMGGGMLLILQFIPVHYYYLSQEIVALLASFLGYWVGSILHRFYVA